MPLHPPIGDQDHLQGDRNAPVILVHYGDFECPYSWAASRAVPEVLEQASGPVCYVFRSFPLDDIHPHAMRAAEAAEAAAAQGRFWPMYDLLFENQRALEDGDLVRYAAEAGLDTERFARELGEGVYLDRLREAQEQGRAAGVRGTPSFFINGVLHDNREGLWIATRLLKQVEAARNTG